MSLADDIQRAFTLIRQLQGALGGNRVIAGRVDSGGSKVGGTGFSVSRASAGRYEITPDVAFPSGDAPAVAPTPLTSNMTSRADNVTNTSFFVEFRNSAGTATDTAFHFTAVGPA